MFTSAEYLANDVTLFAVGYKTSKNKNSEGAMYYLRNMQEWNGCGVLKLSSASIARAAPPFEA